MTGVTVTPAPTGTMAGVDKFTGQTQSASSANSQRIASVAERLDAILHAGHLSREMGIFNLCLALSRGIDYAIANNEVPLKADQLPLLLKKMCQCRNVHALQAAIMVLMISVKPGFIMGLQRVGLVPPGALDKNACMFKWFSDKDTEELLALVNEIGRSFSISDVNTESDHFLPIVSKIMARFYPRMKMGKILVSLEVKPGYGAYSVDFHILKDGTFSSREKIWLFVAQTDDIETSSCIVSPSQVSFLLNGKGVEKRTNVLMDTGPQIPTNVTGMLKYGTNILQAVGQFNGHYIIAIAIMSVTSCPDTTKLHDFVQPVVATLDSDSEIIEGPSRISLKCPMSFSRIKTPVKGHLCKHLQNWDQTVQQVASQPPIGYRHSSGLPTEQQRPPNQRMNQNISQSPNLMRSSAQLPWTQNQQDGVGHLSATHLLASAQRTSQNALQSHPVPVQTMRTGPVNAERVRSLAGRVQTLSRADDMVDLTSEPNWQPQGRMRGSITGRPFSADLEPYIIQPTQPSNPTSRPPPNPTLAPSTAP